MFSIFACALGLASTGCSGGGGSGGSLPPAAALSAPGQAASPGPIALAPAASVTPGAGTYAVAAGTQPFPTGPFDALVTNPIERPDSAAMLASVVTKTSLGLLQFSTAAAGNPSDNDVPIYIARATDPHYTIHCMAYANCPIEGHDVAIPKGARPSSNLGYTTFRDDGIHDQHMAIRNLDTGREDDLWLAPQPNDTGGTLNVGYGGSYDFSSSGVGRAGATAAGFALSNGRVRAVDLLAGRIPYALALVTPCENGHVLPAVGGDGATTAGCPPLGAHVWLDSNSAEIAGSGAPSDFQVILRAMNEFGGYIVDRCTQCMLGVTLEGGLGYTSFGSASPWQAIASLHPGATSSSGAYHIPVSSGSIDLSTHLHVLSN